MTFEDVVKRMLRRIERESDKDMPSLVNPPVGGTIDDGGQYGDLLRDPRPEIVQDATRGWRVLGYLSRDGQRPE